MQYEDDNLKLILDILCRIYQGEVCLFNDFVMLKLHTQSSYNLFKRIDLLQETLCIQFWDRDSFIDGPVRCLLCNLEGEFPFRTIELLRLLSALSKGAWPSECV